MRNEFYTLIRPGVCVLEKVVETKRVGNEIRYIETGKTGQVVLDRPATVPETEALNREELHELYRTELKAAVAAIEANKGAKPYGEILYTLGKFLGLIQI